MRHGYRSAFAVLLLAGCAASSISVADDQFECHAIFDAGSTGTRLWIYYKDRDAWIGEEIKKTAALANLKTLTGDPKATKEIVDVLKLFKKTIDKSKCDSISTIKVLATGGMRLVEQHDDTSNKFWQKLYDALDVIKGNATLTTQTITGYEEGIYAWLATREVRKKANLTDINFGIAEMGGVSSQVVFPCPGCTDPRIIYGSTRNETKLFVHSFLKLGTTQLPKSLGLRPALPRKCRWGAGMKRSWEPKHCAKPIKLGLLESKTEGKKTTYQIKDPHLGVLVPIPDATNVENWYLAGSFGYIDARINGDVHNCCEHQHEKFRGCFDEVRSCFIAIYRPIFLGALGIKDKELKKLGESGYNHSELGRVLGKKLGLSAVNLEELDKELKKLDIEDPKVKRGNDLSWTSGARICEAINCFPEKPTRECSWLPDSKCLVPPK